MRVNTGLSAVEGESSHGLANDMASHLGTGWYRAFRLAHRDWFPYLEV